MKEKIIQSFLSSEEFELLSKIYDRSFLQQLSNESQISYYNEAKESGLFNNFTITWFDPLDEDT